MQPAIVLACAVTLPKSIGHLRLLSLDPRAALHIRYNFFRDPDDLDRMIEAVELSRKIGQSAPLSDIIEFEVAPGDSAMDRKALRNNIVSNVAACLHSTSTAPMGTDSDPTSVVDAGGKVHGVEGLRLVDASILQEIPSAPANVTTIMAAKRVAERTTARSTKL